MTGYHYNPPFGLDVPEGKYFNPYYDHMIIGMAPQLHDGMIEYDDGTPASAPQMAHDVSEYLTFIARNKVPDTKMAMILYFILALRPIGSSASSQRSGQSRTCSQSTITSTCSPTASRSMQSKTEATRSLEKSSTEHQRFQETCSASSRNLFYTDIALQNRAACLL